jgi:hypothetical protein
MTKDEIFQLAERAGFYLSALAPECGRIWWSDECPLDEELLRFAALVAAAEREACAKVCDERERANLYGVYECANEIRNRSEK